MIAKLTGLLDGIDDDSIVVDVGGVGYLVYCSTRTLSRFQAAGEPVSLIIETHVREQHIHLYGFPDATERNWFRRLTTVQGVGVRAALAILSVLGPADLLNAIVAGDTRTIARAPGVGPRLAGRIAGELRDKVDDMGVPAPAADTGGHEAAGDAVSALVNLGYSRADAHGAVATAARTLGADAGVEGLVRHALQELAS